VQYHCGASEKTVPDVKGQKGHISMADDTINIVFYVILGAVFLMSMGLIVYWFYRSSGQAARFREEGPYSAEVAEQLSKLCKLQVQEARKRLNGEGL